MALGSTPAGPDPAPADPGPLQTAPGIDLAPAGSGTLATETPETWPTRSTRPTWRGSAPVATGPARPLTRLTVQRARNPAGHAVDPVAGTPAMTGRRAPLPQPPAGSRPIDAGGQPLIARRAGPLLTRPPAPAASATDPAATWPYLGWADAGEAVGPPPVPAAHYVAGSEEPSGHAGEASIAAGGHRAPDGSVVFAPPAGSGSAAAPGLLRQAAATATGSTEPAPADAATLADELYERVERRLRAELLLDRERKGLLADLRGSGS